MTGSVIAILAGACLALPDLASAQCVTPVRDGSFEGQRGKGVAAPWTAEGAAGTWIRVADVRLTAPCDDDPGQPGQ